MSGGVSIENANRGDTRQRKAYKQCPVGVRRKEGLVFQRGKKWLYRKGSVKIDLERFLCGEGWCLIQLVSLTQCLLCSECSANVE